MQIVSPPPVPPRRRLLSVLGGAATALAGAGLILWLQAMIYMPAVEQGRLVAIGIPALLLTDALGICLFAIGLAAGLTALKQGRGG